MKVRTKQDVEVLDQRIKDELGIDVRKYRNEEVVESFVELLIFPQYVINWGIRPILVSIVLFISGFYVLDLVHIEYVIYGIIGLLLFLALGILIGLFFLTWKMKSDMWGILNYSLEIMRSAVMDINLVNNQVNKENRKEVLGLLFNGIIHIVTIPMISKVIADKVPLIGILVNKVIKKILTLVSNKVTFDEENMPLELNKKETKSNIVNGYSNSISAAIRGLEKVENITFGIVQMPLKIGGGIVLMLLVFFLYLIN